MMKDNKITLLTAITKLAVENAELKKQLETKHAMWKRIGIIGCDFGCTNCGNLLDMRGSAQRPENAGYYYCMNCGANMDGKENENENKN